MQTKRFGLCAALSAAALLLLAGCAGSGSTAAPTLTVESSYPLQYAKQFTVDECTGGYELITIADSQYLVVPQGAAVPEDLPQGTTVLQQPIENIYLVSTSAMDPIISLGALDSIALSGTKADGWYLPEAKAAMQAGQIAYAGKYSAPDYETILASGCGLAIENTMIYHTPEVKEQLEKFGIPVLVERSSYETDPLARMEWVKLYGILLGKQQEAEQLFDTQVQRVAPLDSIALSGTKADGWYLPEAKAAMQAGQIAYAGKYSAPDYETILASGCGLAIENTMIYHTPEVKEQLEKFGIPVLVERSSYETDPLARMEWVKLYGILLGKQQEAEQLFDTQVQRVAPLENQQPTGKTVAFFSITSNNLVTVRKGSDYVARMIEMAGGSYVFADLTDSGNNLATINLSLEDFYAGAKDADVLLYNSTIEGSIASTEQLVEKCPLLAQFKAVQNGNVWCTAQSLFQQSMELPDLILDMNRVFTEGTPADSELTFLTHVE